MEKIEQNFEKNLVKIFGTQKELVNQEKSLSKILYDNLLTWLEKTNERIFEKVLTKEDLVRFAKNKHENKREESESITLDILEKLKNQYKSEGKLKEDSDMLAFVNYLERYRKNYEAVLESYLILLTVDDTFELINHKDEYGACHVTKPQIDKFKNLFLDKFNFDNFLKISCKFLSIVKTKLKDKKSDKKTQGEKNESALQAKQALSKEFYNQDLKEIIEQMESKIEKLESIEEHHEVKINDIDACERVLNTILQGGKDIINKPEYLNILGTINRVYASLSNSVPELNKGDFAVALVNTRKKRIKASQKAA